MIGYNIQIWHMIYLSFYKLNQARFILKSLSALSQKFISIFFFVYYIFPFYSLTDNKINAAQKKNSKNKQLLKDSFKEFSILYYRD